MYDFGDNSVVIFRVKQWHEVVNLATLLSVRCLVWRYASSFQQPR